MNAKKLWIGWAVMGISAAFFALTGYWNIAAAVGSGATVLGWMAYATEK